MAWALMVLNDCWSVTISKILGRIDGETGGSGSSGITGSTTTAVSEQEKLPGSAAKAPVKKSNLEQQILL